MVSILPPPVFSLHQIPNFNRHTQPIQIGRIASHLDTSGNRERHKLLETLKNPRIFEAVLDESSKPSVEIKTLRSQLAKQKISTKELFACPELLINLYSHLEKEINNKLKQLKASNKQEDLKLQALMMKSLVTQLSKQYGLSAFGPSTHTQLKKILFKTLFPNLIILALVACL